MDSAAVVAGKLLRLQWQPGRCNGQLLTWHSPRHPEDGLLPASLSRWERLGGRLTLTHSCRGEVYALPAALPQSQPACPPRHFCGRAQGAGLASLLQALMRLRSRCWPGLGFHPEAHLGKDLPPRPGLRDRGLSPMWPLARGQHQGSLGLPQHQAAQRVLEHVVFSLSTWAGRGHSGVNGCSVPFMSSEGGH